MTNTLGSAARAMTQSVTELTCQNVVRATGGQARARMVRNTGRSGSRSQISFEFDCWRRPEEEEVMEVQPTSTPAAPPRPQLPTTPPIEVESESFVGM